MAQVLAMGTECDIALLTGAWLLSALWADPKLAAGRASLLLVAAALSSPASLPRCLSLPPPFCLQWRTLSSLGRAPAALPGSAAV